MLNWRHKYQSRWNIVIEAMGIDAMAHEGSTTPKPGLL